MPNSGDALDASLRVGLAIEVATAISADKQAIIVRQQNELARLRAEQSMPVKKSDADFDLTVAQGEIETLKEILMLKDQALREKNALLLEWMHSNETFKQLAIKFGKKQGLNKESFDDEVAEQAIDVAEETPRFKDSVVFKTSKERITKKTKF
jgi:hypothetical protein